MKSRLQVDAENEGIMARRPPVPDLQVPDITGSPEKQDRRIMSQMKHSGIGH